MFRRKMKTKLPSMRTRQDNETEKEARKKHDEKKRTQKEQYDKKHKAREKDIRPGDKVMIKRKKTTMDTPWDPKEFQVTEIKGAKLILDRQGEIKYRAKNNVKKLKRRGKQNESSNKEQPTAMRREIDLEVSWDKIKAQTESREELQEVTNPGTQEVEEEEDSQDKGSESGNSTDSQFTVVWESAESEKEEDNPEKEQEREEDLEPTSEGEDSRPIATRTRLSAESTRT